MKINLIMAVVLSILFATSLLHDIKFAAAIIIMMFYLSVISRSLLACITIYFFIYLVLAGFADKSSISLSGNQNINLLGILNLMLILVVYLKWIDFLQVRKEFWNKLLLYPIIFFSVYLIMIIPFSVSLMSSIRDLIRMISAFSFYLLVYFIIVNSKNAEDKILKFITALLVPLLVYGIVEYITGFNVFYNRSISYDIYGGWHVIGTFKRISTVFRGAPQYSFVILIFLPLYLYHYFKRKEHSNFYGIILCLLFINLILTFTRISWFTAMIQVCVFFLLFKPKRMLRFAIPGGLFFLLMSGRILVRITTVDGSALGRIKMFQYGLSVLKSHLVFGSGLGTIMESEGTAAHGDYMKMFAETGIFGGVGYLIVLFTIIIFTFKNFQESDFAKIAFITTIGFMIFSMTDNGLAYSHIFWAQLGIYHGMIIRKKFVKHPSSLEYRNTPGNRSIRIAV